MQIQYAKNPKWANADQTQIDLIVKFAEFDTELPFTACETDVVAHSVELFQLASNQAYGTIEEYVPVVIDVSSPVVISVEMRQIRLALLARELLDNVDDAILQITDSVTRKTTTIEWEYSTTVYKSAAWFKALSAQLGLSDQDHAALFLEASVL